MKKILLLILILFVLSFTIVDALRLVEEDIGDYEYQKEELPEGVTRVESSIARYRLKGTDEITNIRIRNFDNGIELHDYLSRKYNPSVLDTKKYGQEIVYIEKNEENLFWVNGNNIFYVSSSSYGADNLPEELIIRYLEEFPNEFIVEQEEQAEANEAAGTPIEEEEVVGEPIEENEVPSPEVVKEEIGNGLVYNIRSSIFKWFQKITGSIKNIFVKNVEVYEKEREEYSDYYRQRNENLKKSLEGNDEPPFNPKICAQSTPINEDTEWNFCSCGDGICASYEDKCNCEKDCGSCPEGTICKRGECVEYVKDTCMNRVCEEGENETCPWDCNVYMQEEKEEINGEPKEEVKEILPELVE